MKKALILLALIAGLAISCKGETSKSSTEAKVVDPYTMEGVMAVHDEVMPKMGQMAKLSSALKPLADASPEGPEAKAIEDLKVAHEAMMTWMKEIGDTFTHEEIMKGAVLSDEKKEALRVEADKIAEVKRLMLESISNAEALLKE
ncbi:MAG: hypothetical protein VW034_00270 [Flavobacteriaceae bacterium]